VPATCLVCKSNRFQRHGRQLKRCLDCHFVTADLENVPAAAEIYGDTYFHGDAYQDYEAERDWIHRNFQDRLVDLRRYETSGRLVEIGSAYGYFLDLAKDDFQCRGFDVNETAVQAGQARGLDVTTADFLTTDMDSLQPTDAAVLWDVIEHLPNPDAFLFRLGEVVKPGGHILITTGDIASLNARLRGDRWRMIQPPIHLHYFSPATLGHLLDRAGFDVVEVKHVGNKRSIHQMLFGIVALRARLPGLYRFLAKFIRADAALYLNLHDIMLVVGRKRAPVVPLS
jgi:SAM-dependent methyltransferase